jgi:hypothetical protein
MVQKGALAPFFDPVKVFIYKVIKTKLESMKLIVSFTGIKSSCNTLANARAVKTSFLVNDLDTKRDVFLMIMKDIKQSKSS